MGGGFKSFKVDGGVERRMRAGDMIAFDEIVGVNLPIGIKADSGLVGRQIGFQRLVRQFGGQVAELLQQRGLRIHRGKQKPTPFGQMHGF